MATANDIGPFRTIVNVSWDSFRYYVVGTFGNSFEAPNGHPWTPHQTDVSALGAFTGGWQTEPFSCNSGDFILPDNQPPSLGLDAINSIVKRKFLIDHTSNYFFLASEGYYDEVGGEGGSGVLTGGQIAAYFFIGKYIVDHPHVDSFFATFAAGSLACSLDRSPTNPITKPRLAAAHCTDWSLPDDGLDGGPSIIGP